MSIFSLSFRNPFRREMPGIPSSTSGEPSTSSPSNPPTTGASAPVRLITPSITTSSSVAAFRRVLDLRSSTFARPTLQLLRHVNGSWHPETKFLTHAEQFRPILYLLTVRPNTWHSAHAFFTRLQYWRDIEGSSAIWFPGGPLQASQIYPMRSIQYIQGTDTYSCFSEELGSTYIIPLSELVILRGSTSPANLSIVRPGISLYDTLKQTLSLYLTAQQFATLTYAKGGTQKMFISEQQPVGLQDIMASLDDKEAKKAYEDIRRQVSEDYDVIFLQGDLKSETRQQSFQDLQTDLHQNKAIEDIARVGGIPLPLMFCSTNAVYKSIDDAFHSFIGLTMSPLWQELEQELNHLILGEQLHGQLAFRFDLSNLCIDSEKNIAQAASVRITSGITTPNEERMRLNLCPLPDGDSLQNGRSRQPISTQTTPPAKGGAS